MKNNYILIDCGLINKYLVRKEDIKFIDKKTLLTIYEIKDFSSYTLENKNGKLLLSNGLETLVFEKLDKEVKCFKYFLDEFANPVEYF